MEFCLKFIYTLLIVDVVFYTYTATTPTSTDPAKIISVNVSKTTLHLNDEFVMQVKVEGNPMPTTTFRSLTDGKTWYNETTKDGNYTIGIPMVKCVETGNYELTCENSLVNDSIRENIYVLCRPEPDPRFPLNNTMRPRLGDNINITVHVVGYPRASFQWRHGGTQLFNHTDADNTTTLALHDIQFEYFGEYELVMKNTAGNSSVLFDVQADGPPDSAYDLKVSDITTNTANISFITGYDYNATQSFYIMRDVAGKHTDFHRKVNGIPNDHGGRHVSVVISDLQESTAYNLVVRSGNSRGNSTDVSNNIIFLTYGKPEPDPEFHTNTTFKPRLGDSVTLTAHAQGLPIPIFQWKHNGKLINSTADNYTSIVVITDIDVGDFGEYTLNVTNKYGTYSDDYEVIAEGPPDSAYDLKVSDVTTNTANISFITGYDYNATQSFYIMREVAGKQTDFHRMVTDTPNDHGGRQVSVVIGDLQESTAYNLVVRSGNSRGNSTDVSNNIMILTCGKPEPDPEFHTNTTFKPRLGDSVTLTAHAQGLPIPIFQWKHNGKLVNSTADNYTSIVVITDVVVDDFGEYTLNMTNKYGTYLEDYEVFAEGPPDAVTMLSSSDATEDSVKLKWKTGFDYGSKQSFEIEGTVNDKDLINMNDISDTSGGIGGMETAKLENLESSSSYKIYLVAKNARGSATSESNTVSFTTKGASNKGKSKTTADYVGYVVGGIGAVLLIIVIISVIRRCLKRRKEVPYEMFPER